MSTTDSYRGFCHNNRMQADREKKQFSERLIRALRDSDLRDKAQKEQGKALGAVSGTTVHYWLTGQKMPDIAHAVLISKRLAVNFEWLMTGRGPMRLKEGISPQGLRLLAVFEGLPDKEKGEVLAYAAFVIDRMGDKPVSKELTSLAEDINPGVTPPSTNN